MSGESSHQTVSQSLSHSVNSGGGANFKFFNATFTMFFFSSKLQECAYKPVYAFICTDGKVNLMSNMTTRETQM